MYSAPRPSSAGRCSEAGVVKLGFGGGYRKSDARSEAGVVKLLEEGAGKRCSE